MKASARCIALGKSFYVLIGSKIEAIITHIRLISKQKTVDIICIEQLIYAYGGEIMRTTLDLPEDLLIEAMTTTKIETKTKVIITALEELIRKVRISELKTFKGRVDLDINMDKLRGRECRP